MALFDRFSAAFPLDHFLVKYGNAATGPGGSRLSTPSSSPTIRRNCSARSPREMNVIVLAGAWCGDCAQQCPIFDRFAEAAKVIKVRYLDNAEHADVQEVLSVNGGKRHPGGRLLQRRWL